MAAGKSFGSERRTVVSADGPPEDAPIETNRGARAKGDVKVEGEGETDDGEGPDLYAHAGGAGRKEGGAEKGGVNSVFVHVVFSIQAVHQPHIDGDQNNEDVHGALVGHPETELEAADPDAVELVGEKDRTAKGNKGPDRKERGEDAQICLPVRATVFGGSHKTRS